MSTVRTLYLILALAGLLVPWYFNLQFMQESGGQFGLADFIAAANVNAATRSLSWDLAIACIAGLSWIFIESRRLGMRFSWVYILLAFGVAYAFAFPLFLFVRQGVLEKQTTQKG